MHYIHYTPGTIARIATWPDPLAFCRSHSDVNKLSQIVSKFNSWVWLNHAITPTNKTAKLEQLCRDANL